MKRFLVIVAILGALGCAMLLLAMAQNDGCLPWKERVGMSTSPFSGIEDNTRCR